MQASDLSRSVLIVAAFALLYLFNVLTVGIGRVKKNWVLYRCNPAVMPFASLFGHDAMQNFTFCIQNMQTNFMGHLLQPLHYNFNLIGNVTGSISDAVNDVRQFFYKLRSMIASLTQTLFAVFLNVVVEFQRVTIAVRDMFGKLTGMLVVLIYTVGGTMMTAKSWYDGPPGELLRGVAKFACFAPDTQVRLACGKTLAMKDVPLGAALSNGAEVRAVMRVKNPGGREPYYEIDGIHVTGNHLVYDTSARAYVRVMDFPDSRLSGRAADTELACLITTNNTIQIGTRLFHDWDDNQP
jgi:hypothetical protein